jgi:PhnB protein
MAIKKLNPYLNFNGTAGKAIQLYEKALGAKVENIMRFGDAGPMGEKMSPEHKDLVLHAALQIGDGGVIMISDGQPGVPVPTESNTHISLDFDDAADMARKFEALGSGGQVTMPLQDQFWGARFGMLTDAFGIRWMFNCWKK